MVIERLIRLRNWLSDGVINWWSKPDWYYKPCIVMAIIIVIALVVLFFMNLHYKAKIKRLKKLIYEIYKS